eukprot:gene5803-6391_t
MMTRPAFHLTFSLLPLLVTGFHFVNPFSRGCLHRLPAFSRLQCLTTSTPSSASNTPTASSTTSTTSSPQPNSRFWTQIIDLPITTPLANTDGAAVVARIDEAVQKKEVLLPATAENALLLVPSHHLLLPLHGGMLQHQHVTYCSDLCAPSPSSPSTSTTTASTLRLILLVFHPRAQQTSESFTEKERKLDPIRLAALEEALKKHGSITGAELLAEPYLGTSPSRIYRSFICPHPRAVFTVEPIPRAAERAAQQIELALRQWRADQATYLRNVDRPADLTQNLPRHPIVLVLDNLRSAFNVGSIFRSAETAGVEEVITCGITPHPPHPKVAKTAFSAVQNVPSRHFDSVLEALAVLKKDGYTIVAMETTSRSQVYSSVVYPQKVALVLGNELIGVDAKVMEEADLLAEIPTYGLKNSLNVASAAPIVLFEVLRQWREGSGGLSKTTAGFSSGGDDNHNTSGSS